MKKNMDIAEQLHFIQLIRHLEFRKNASSQLTHPGQLPFLDYLSRNDGCTQQQLAEDMHVSPASIAVSAKRLERSGWIRRVTDSSNLRCNRLTLTPEGKKVLEDTRKIFDQINSQMLTGFSEKEKASLHSMLDKILLNLHADTVCPSAEKEGCPRV